MIDGLTEREYERLRLLEKLDAELDMTTKREYENLKVLRWLCREELDMANDFDEILPHCFKLRDVDSYVTDNQRIDMEECKSNFDYSVLCLKEMIIDHKSYVKPQETWTETEKELYPDGIWTMPRAASKSSEYFFSRHYFRGGSSDLNDSIPEELRPLELFMTRILKAASDTADLKMACLHELAKHPEAVNVPEWDMNIYNIHNVMYRYFNLGPVENIDDFHYYFPYNRGEFKDRTNDKHAYNFFLHEQAFDDMFTTIGTAPHGIYTKDEVRMVNYGTRQLIRLQIGMEAEMKRQIAIVNKIKGINKC